MKTKILTVVTVEIVNGERHIEIVCSNGDYMIRVEYDDDNLLNEIQKEIDDDTEAIIVVMEIDGVRHIEAMTKNGVVKHRKEYVDDSLLKAIQKEMA